MKYILTSLLVILGGAGCVGYVAGPTNGLPAGSKSIRVEFFDNETLEPRLVTAVNRALKRNLQQDGTYRLQTSGNADLVVKGKLTEFLRNGISYESGDLLKSQDYNFKLIAQVTVTDGVTGELIFEGDITGSSLGRVDNDLASLQRQTVPLIADHLAKQATSLIVDGKWPSEPAGP